MQDKKLKIIKVYLSDLQPPSYRYIAKKCDCSPEYVRQVINAYADGKIPVSGKFTLKG